MYNVYNNIYIRTTYYIEYTYVIINFYFIFRILKNIEYKTRYVKRFKVCNLKQ